MSKWEVFAFNKENDQLIVASSGPIETNLGREGALKIGIECILEDVDNPVTEDNRDDYTFEIRAI